MKEITENSDGNQTSHESNEITDASSIKSLRSRPSTRLNQSVTSTAGKSVDAEIRKPFQSISKTNGRGAITFTASVAPTRATSIAAARRASMAPNTRKIVHSTQRQHVKQNKTLAAPPITEILEEKSDIPESTQFASDMQQATEPTLEGVRSAFQDALSLSERSTALDELLKFRSKVAKYNQKARSEEQLVYIRQLKAAIRSVHDEVGPSNQPNMLQHAIHHLQFLVEEL